MDAEVTQEKLIAACMLLAYQPSVGRPWAEELWPWMRAYSITTPKRVAPFLAQITHESGGFKWLREIGSDSYLSKYDTGKLAERLGNTPEADGDGQLYCGRGLIQLTGRANYARAGKDLCLPLLTNPDMAEKPFVAARLACWFWDSRKLNALADSGDNMAFLRITKKINGGLNGLEDRLRRWSKAREVLEA